MTLQKTQESILNWNSHSSVRSKPNKYVIPDQKPAEKDWFPKKMVPYLDLPCFASVKKEKVDRLLAQHLVYFLDYTTILEHLMVNRSLEVIVHNKLNISIPESLRKASLQIYTDEAYHALFSDELSCSVAGLYGIRRLKRRPYRIAALEQLIQQTPEKHRNEVYFAIGFVSETIIAKEIARLIEKNLVPPVYAMFRDHLDDEIRHAFFFSEAFQVIWQRITLPQKHIIARALPTILKIFASMDPFWLTQSIEETGIPREACNHIIAESTSLAETIKRVKSGSSMTISVLRNANIFSDKMFSGYFHTEELLIG